MSENVTKWTIVRAYDGNCAARGWHLMADGEWANTYPTRRQAVEAREEAMAS